MSHEQNNDSDEELEIYSSDFDEKTEFSNSKCNYCGKELPYNTTKVTYCSFSCAMKNNPLNVILIGFFLTLSGIILILLPTFTQQNTLLTELELFWIGSGFLVLIIGCIGVFIGINATKERNYDLKTTLLD